MEDTSGCEATWKVIITVFNMDAYFIGYYIKFIGCFFKIGPKYLFNYTG